MDRRALVALFISTLVIFAWQVFFLPPPEDQLEPPEEETAAAPTTSGKFDTRRDETISSDIEVPDPGRIGALDQNGYRVEPEGLAAADVVEEVRAQTVFVSTPLYAMEIDTKGGVVRSIQLLKYKNYEKTGPVSLTNPQGPGGLGLILNTSNGEVDLRRVVFQADQSSVRITDEAGRAALRLEQTLMSGVTIRRTFLFAGDTYRVDIEQEILRDPASPEVFSYRMLWEPGIEPTELAAGEIFEPGGRGAQTEELLAISFVGTSVVKDRYGKIKEGGVSRSGSVKWAAVKTKYFAIALIPPENSSADFSIYEDQVARRIYFEAKFPVQSSQGDTRTFGLYAGPIDWESLKAEGNDLDRMIDFGWSLIEPVSRLMLRAMLFLHKFLPNFGVVIIVISIITKLLFYRLTHKSFQSMKDMQAIQGQVAEIKEKHKNDQQRLNKETWALYKKEGVNPMGGCLPMLMQMPVFIALYNVLRSTIYLRQAPFVFWINDLSRQEILFPLPFALPFLGAAFSLLPLLMGISMFLQQKMTTVDPRQKAMIYIMPVMFTVLFYKLPSGLVLYWLVNNVLSIAQQWLIHRGGGDGKKPEPSSDTQRNDEKTAGPKSRGKKGRGRRRALPAKETP